MDGASQVNDLGQRYEQVLERMGGACARAHRDPTSVRLIAVSKHQPASAIRAAAALGVTDFGENYAQELCTKHLQLSDVSNIRWHMIGHLQTNKIRQVVPITQSIHTIDSERGLLEISRRAVTLGALVEGFVQIDLAGETQKAGCQPDELPRLLEVAADLPGVRIVGLMAIPPAGEPTMKRRQRFRQLRTLAESQQQPLRRLSMGMSDDFEAAIEEGATDIRVGTALFGARQEGR